MCVCVCVCVCKRDWVKTKEGDKGQGEKSNYNNRAQRTQDAHHIIERKLQSRKRDPRA